MTGSISTRSALNSVVLGACDILRGPINQDEFKEYVTPLLFFKRLSDVYDDETADALEESGGDADFAALPENHSFVIPEGLGWSHLRNATKDVGRAIVESMSGVERANPDTLSGLFSSFDDASWTDKAKLSDARLKDLIEHFSKVRLGNRDYSADVMGDAYELLIKKFADDSKKNAAEFYTPREIVALMVRMLDPRDGESVYDPACGTGGMLIEAVRHMHDRRLAYGRVFGQENNLSTSAIARMNLFLHGASDFRIAQGDTLRHPQFLEGDALRRFDCVLANPPFALKDWPQDEWPSDPYGRNAWGSPTGKQGSNWAWLEHMYASMDPRHGRCAVIMPQGVLFRGGKEARIRRRMLETHSVDAVVTLAGGVFFSTNVSACIVLLDNGKPEERKYEVCLVDGTGIFTSARAQNYISKENADELYGLWRGRRDVTERCRVVTLGDIADRGWTLQPSTYIEHELPPVTPPEETYRRFGELLARTKRDEAGLRRLLREGGYLG